MPRQEHLFSTRESRDYLEVARHALTSEIDELLPDRVTSTDLDALINFFVEKYTLMTPVLDEEHITVDQQEVQVDVSRDPQRMAYFLNPGRPTYVAGTRVTHYVPFTGDADLFHLRPSCYSSNFPSAAIHGNELAFTEEDTRHDSTSIQMSFREALNETKKLLAWLDNDVRAYNASIPVLARERLATRRDKLHKDQHLVQTLGYPLRQRTDAPKTYAPSTVRKKIALPPRQPQVPAEPALETATYEDILGIIQSMALVLERSPRAFQGMSEEDLRTHFLVQLNGHYEGAATGETFNESGKTDILIRHENKNLFIAECKFWSGPAGLTDALDQLLGYASWRDTKTAILLFSKNKDFTNVLSQIPPTVNAHPNTLRQERYQSETGYRFTLHHQHDKERHLTLTILAFNIPA